LETGYDVKKGNFTLTPYVGLAHDTVRRGSFTEENSQFGLTAGKKILEDALAYSVILLSAYSDEHYVQKAKTNGISAYLVKPLDAKSLIPMVEVCIEKGRQLQQMSNEMVKLSKKIDDRIVIEKAKGLLMARDHLSEPEAFKRIRTISMQKRVPMIEIAKLLVLQDDV